MIKRPYDIVGHRGFPKEYPENSLVGLVAAAKLGADAVELDVQVSADGELMVYHDEDLLRTCGVVGKIWQFSAEELSHISCHESNRFGDKFYPTYIATLEQVCEALSAFSCHVFVEVKEKSIKRVGRDTMLSSVIRSCKSLAGRYSIISFDYSILEMAKPHVPIGWALREMTPDNLKKATTLSPWVLITDVKNIELNQGLWSGPWRWFLYDIIDPDEAIRWSQHGASFIETWDAQSLLSSHVK